MQQLLKAIYYNQFAKIKEKILFFDWLNTYLHKHRITIPDYHPSLCAIEGQVKLWHNPITKQSTVFVHPPLHTISILIPKNDSAVATPFKNPWEGDREKDSQETQIFFDEIRKIIEQNNYSNQILHPMATQIDSIST